LEECATFGVCLSELLTVKGWSASCLAKALNVDPSYTRRWIRGYRVPSIKSSYVKDITKCLCSDLNSASGRKLCEGYRSALSELGFKGSSSIDNLIEECLRDSQLYSLSLSNEERIIKSSTSEDAFINLVMKIGKTEEPPAYLSYQNTYSQLCTPGVIKGRQSVLYASISLLRAAAKSKQIKKGDVIITFQSDSYIFDGTPELEASFEKELSCTLENGWRVWHLIKLNKNLNRSMKLVKKIIERLWFDQKYTPVYFDQYGTTYPAEEAIIVQGIGALIYYSTTNSSSIDTALYINMPDALENLLSHYMLSIKRTKPLINVMTLEEYFIHITENDKKPGSTYIIKNDLGLVTIPPKLWEKYVLRTLDPSENSLPHIERISSRLDSFHNQIAACSYMHICSMEAVEHLISNGEYIYDNVYRKPTLEDIKEHIENVIYLLDKYENFEIGLISPIQKELLPPVFYEIKEDGNVIIEMWNPDATGLERSRRGLYLSISEKNLTNAFIDFYTEIWYRITPKYRDKSYVIQWFKKQLKSLEIKLSK
jgi:hypothetical protein